MESQKTLDPLCFGHSDVALGVVAANTVRKQERKGIRQTTKATLSKQSVALEFAVDGNR